MLGKKCIPLLLYRYLISRIAKIDPCGKSEKILIKLKRMSYTYLMAEIIYCPGSKIKIFSGFNIVVTISLKVSIEKNSLLLLLCL